MNRATPNRNRECHTDVNGFTNVTSIMTLHGCNLFDNADVAWMPLIRIMQEHIILSLLS